MPSSCLPQMCAELTVTHERANARENKEIPYMYGSVEDGAWWYHRYVLNELAASDRRDP